MKKRVFASVVFLFLLVSNWGYSQSVNDYAVKWDSPSKNASGSMPVGNGEVGANVWVEENGDLLFYISRTDSWSEIATLMKLGRIRVSLSPNPFKTGTPFVQELNLRDGNITIKAGEKGKEVNLKLIISSEAPVIYLAGQSDIPVSVTATAEVWRDKMRKIEKKELGFSVSGCPDNITFFEYPDTITGKGNNVIVYHRNAYSEYPIIMEHQKLQLENKEQYDPFVNRTSGIHISGKSFVKVTPTAVKTNGKEKNFTLKVAALTAQTSDAQTWIKQIEKVVSAASGFIKAETATKKYWNHFWDKSYLFVTTPDGSTGHKITQSYLLQRWITACAARGTYPVKFNGSIFTTDPVYTDPTCTFSPDYRLWGGDYWWQNTRLVYHPLLQTGNFDMMKVLFNHYYNNLPVMKSTAKSFFNASGAVSAETATIFGTYTNNDYGWNRNGLADGDVESMYIKHYWSSGLEIVALMYDYYQYTKDSAFANERLVPMAYEFLSFFDSFFPRNSKGILEITPTHALETYWYDVKNDLPCVAGLHYVINGLQTLPAEIGSSNDRALWNRLAKILPQIPTETRNGTTVFAVAESYNPKRSNVENPDLYAIFPFPFSNFTSETKQIGIDTYNQRIIKGTNGWAQDGQQAAILGLTEEAQKNLLSKIENNNPNQRFPVMWGPNFDWVPDQDHGSNLLITLQSMVLQSYDSTIYLLPAFPKEWGVSFKLHTPDNNVVEGAYNAGTWERKPTLRKSANQTIQICN